MHEEMICIIEDTVVMLVVLVWCGWRGVILLAAGNHSASIREQTVRLEGLYKEKDSDKLSHSARFQDSLHDHAKMSGLSVFQWNILYSYP